MDRSGIQWLRFALDPSDGSLSYLAHGRFYDKNVGDPYSFTMPSLMVNCAGDMISAFSGFNSSSYLGAYYCARLVGGETFEAPRLIQPGLTNYYSPRLGDYSATTLDPSDEWTFWTIQQYADPGEDPNGDYPWKTVIAKIRPQP